MRSVQCMLTDRKRASLKYETIKYVAENDEARSIILFISGNIAHVNKKLS